MPSWIEAAKPRAVSFFRPSSTRTFANAAAIPRILENAGAELSEENGGGPGVRLKQRLRGGGRSKVKRTEKVDDAAGAAY
jgi:hypothetical protein